MTLLACTNTSCGQQYEKEDRAPASRLECPSCGGRLERCENAKLASAAKTHSLRDLIASPVLTSPSRDFGKYIEFACEHCQAIGKATKERLGRTAICPKCRQSTRIALPAALPCGPSVAPDRDVETIVNGDVEFDANQIVADARERLPSVEAAGLAAERERQASAQREAEAEIVRRAEEVARQLADEAARLRAEEIAQRETEARAALEAEQRQQQAIAEQQRKAEEDKRRAEELRIAQEEQRQREEAEQAQRKTEEDKRRAEELRIAQEEQRQREEAEQTQREAEEAKREAEELLAQERQAAKEEAARREEARLQAIERQEVEERLRQEARQRAIRAATQAALAVSSESQRSQGAICRSRFDMPLSNVLAEPTGCTVLGVPVSLDLYVRNSYRLLGTPGALGNQPLHHRRKSNSGDAVSLGYEWHARPVAPMSQSNARGEQELFSDLFWLNPPDDAFAAVTAGGKLGYPQPLRILDDRANSLADEPLALVLHAAAVVSHNQAICMECAYAAGYRVGPELFWDEAFVRWHVALEHPCFWNCVLRRAASLSLVASVESLRAQLWAAILSLNGALAQAYAAAENESACQRHLACIARCRFGGDDAGALAEEIARSIYSY